MAFTVKRKQQRGKKFIVIGKFRKKYAEIMAKDAEEARKIATAFFGPFIKVKIIS